MKHERDLRTERVHERAVVRGACTAVCAEWGLEVLDIEHPEDMMPPPERPLDGVVTTTGPGLAAEHTRYLSFVDEVRNSVEVEKMLHKFVEQLSGSLPPPGHYELGLRPGAIVGHKNTDLDSLERWIRTKAATLSARRALQGPKHFIVGNPPDVPFHVVLYRWPSSDIHPDGTLTFAGLIDLEELPELNLEQTTAALRKKLPKLEEQRSSGGRTLLIFEERDIQLVNTGTATNAVRRALERCPELPAPDAIVLVYSRPDPWLLEWIKDGDRWYPDLAERRPVRLSREK